MKETLILVALSLLTCAPRAEDSAPVEAPKAEKPSAAPAPAAADQPKQEAKPEAKSEVKPEPRPEPKPEVKEQSKPSRPPAVDLTSEERTAAEWRFLKQAGEDRKTEMSEAVLAQLNRLLRANPDADFADEALRLKADLHERLGDPKAAAMAALRLLSEAPSSKLAFPAKRALMELVDRKFDRKLKPALAEIARGSEAGDKPTRIAALLKKLVEQTGDALYEPLAGEFEEFFARFPAYPKSDELALLLGDLHARKGRYSAAILAYQRLLALYPASAYRARAQRMVAEVLAANLKDYSKAIDAYQEVVNRYPDNEEAGIAYVAIAKIEEQLKQYDLAVDIYEKIVKLYPGTDPALKALNAEARLFSEQLDRPTQAIEAYGKVADMFKDNPASAKALKAAAAIARKQKDYSTELALSERLAKEVPDSAEAPESLYSAAQICEDQLQNPGKAIELYTQLVEKYPAHKLARKAKSRAAALAKK